MAEAEKKAMEAVRQDPLALADLPDKAKTREVCREALRQAYFELEAAPEKLAEALKAVPERYLEEAEFKDAKLIAGLMKESRGAMLEEPGVKELLQAFKMIGRLTEEQRNTPEYRQFKADMQKLAAEAEEKLRPLQEYCNDPVEWLRRAAAGKEASGGAAEAERQNSGAAPSR